MTSELSIITAVEISGSNTATTTYYSPAIPVAFITFDLLFVFYIIFSIIIWKSRRLHK